MNKVHEVDPGYHALRYEENSVGQGTLREHAFGIIQI